MKDLRSGLKGRSRNILEFGEAKEEKLEIWEANKIVAALYEIWALGCYNLRNLVTLVITNRYRPPGRVK
jgi:hypothetical protein